MDNDSTRNSGRLSLAERAKRGWELLTREIMELEFPAYTSYEDRQQPEYKGWHKAIEAAIRLEFLEKRPEQVEILLYASIPKIDFLSGVPLRPPREVYGTETRYWITRENYRQWRLTQPNPPAGSLIHLWLGATPGMAVSLPAESIPPVETFPLEMPVSTAQTPVSTAQTPVSTAQTPVSTAQTPVALGGGNPVHRRKRVADKREFIKSATWLGNQTNTVNGHPQAARFKGAYGEACLLKWASELDPRLRDKRGGRPRKT